ncbi:hypothetical protein AOQ84DRAFT_291507 [Glonium stellatum]|uniref:Uncharacterized protein n=1 Tax=Glonium stellatum TaxID=574774 RepID=A0A8E2F2C7_9PEZI|nr:hypothetical protein AOQ84DRAFT_291507 [Glonium stellatum]
MIGGQEGQVLADAFLSASLYPPITKQSLSELDIGNIIHNLKLRHDVNFDRDLSFRPNLDGAKGQEKLKAAETYWLALRAELELYTYLFQGSSSTTRTAWPKLVAASKKRIPLMFDTIREILKNLVPDRDQARVDEHLDASILMQQIERGVCDLVKTSEWLAHLLKEHCAPMRDGWVDKMVDSIRTGVEKPSSESIVCGLRELLGILEAMKLDVANHQIRNLRALLIEDTINFEQKYHLSKIARGRINVEGAQQWHSFEEAMRQSAPPSYVRKGTGRAQFETFVQSLVHILLSNDPSKDFPETFYLDQDRLRALKCELHDIVHFDFCCNVFDRLLRQMNYRGSIPHSVHQDLRSSLFAIIGESRNYSARQWVANIDYVAVELVRHALNLCGFARSYEAELVQKAQGMLRATLCSSRPSVFADRAEILERTVLPEILAYTNRHINSSPMEMFNALIAPSAPPPPPPPPSHMNVIVQRIANEQNSSSSDHLIDIVHRITHIAVLHWRIWGPIVYVLPDEKENISNLKTTNGPSDGRQNRPSEPLVIENESTTPSLSTTSSTPSPEPEPQPGTRQMAGQAPEASTLE